MEEVVYVRRNNDSLQKTKPFIRIESAPRRIYLDEKLVDLMDLEKGDGVMFGFNKKEKKAYIEKDNEEGSFTLYSGQYKESLAFKSKNLCNYFVECLDLDLENKSTVFEVIKEGDKFIIQG